MAFNFKNLNDSVTNPKAQWSAGIVFERTNALPLDKWSIFRTEAKLNEYMSEANCYPGQYVAVVTDTGVVTPYIISADAEGNLVPKVIGGDVAADLSELTTRVAAIEGILGDEDDNITYTFALTADKTGLVITPSEGEAITLNFDVYTKKEVDDKDAATLKSAKDYADGLKTNIEENLTNNYATKKYAEDEADAAEAAAKKHADDELAKEKKRAEDAEKALGERIDAIDYIDEDELAEALEPYALTTTLEAAVEDLQGKIDAIDFLDEDELAEALEPYAKSADVYTKEETDNAIDAAVEGILGEGVSEAYDTLKEIQEILEGKDGAVIDNLLDSISENATAIATEKERAEAKEKELADAIAAIDFIDESELNAAIEAAKTAIDAQGKADKALADAKKYADEKDTETLKSAKDYADGLKGEIVEDLKDYATIEYVDAQDAATLGSAKDYTNAEVAKANAAAKKAQDEVDALETLVGTLPEGTSATDVIGYVNIKTAGIATDAALGELQGQLNGVQGDVTTIKNDYLKAADKTELEGKITNAITTAANDATNKANTAESNAKTYVNEEIAKLHTKTIVSESENNGYVSVDGNDVKVYELPETVALKTDVPNLIDLTPYATIKYVNNQDVEYDGKAQGYAATALANAKTWVGEQKYATETKVSEDITSAIDAIKGGNYVGGTIGELKADLENLSGHVTTVTDKNVAANAEAIAKEVTDRVTALVNLDSRLSQSIGGIEATVVGHGTRLTTAEGNITKNTTDISKNAGDIATLNGTVENHGTRLTTAEGKITTLETKVTNLTGAFIFKGEVESNPTASGFDVSAYTNGDVVIFGTKEYAFDGTKFVELGDEGSYLLKSDAASTYLRIDTAASTYATKNELKDTDDKAVEARKYAEWANVSGKPSISYVETKEETFSVTKTITCEAGKIRNIEVYDADGEEVVVDVKRNNAKSYTLTATGSNETLTVVYDIVSDVE